MLAFIDVSGDPYNQPKHSPWIAANAVCIRKRAIYDITATLHRLKCDNLANEHIELKSSDIVNKSTLNHTHLEKAKYLDNVVIRCLNHHDCMHASVVFENCGGNRRSNSDNLPRHFKDLLWRIEGIAREWKTRDVVVIIDNDKRKIDRNLAFAFNNYLYRTIGGGDLKNILPVPLFADSETTAGIQLADIAAGIVRNYYQCALNEDSENTTMQFHEKLCEYYSIIKKRSIDKKIGKYMIIGIFSPKEPYNI